MQCPLSSGQISWGGVAFTLVMQTVLLLQFDSCTADCGGNKTYTCVVPAWTCCFFFTGGGVYFESAYHSLQ